MGRSSGHRETPSIAIVLYDCQFLKIYALCTPERYDFMHCDLQANPPLAYHCFDYVVAEGDKIVVGGGNSVDIPEDVFSATTKSSDVRNGSSSAK